jgi:predicted MPP superfamily phosphohydrolase
MTRYYVTILSLSAVLGAQVFLAVTALRKVRGSSRLLWLWRIAMALLFLTALITVLSEWRLCAWMPRIIAASAEALFNVSGLLGAAAIAISLLVRLLTDRLPASFRRDRRMALQAIAGMGIAAPAAVAGFGIFVERTNFEVTETPIPIRSLPRELEGLRLVQISDIHLSPYLSERTLERVIDAANELQGDLIFVTGDLISAKGDPLDACLGQLARLNANVPRLGCLGNHEVYADAVEHTVRGGAEVGIEFLRNSTRAIRFGKADLNIAGVDYQPIGWRSRYLRHGASMIRPDAVNILLSHNPDVFPVAAAQGYDVTLAGHTHGGQVTFELLSPRLNPARMLTPYVRGLYREGDRACYVNRGIGTLGVPARLGARPEIALLKLTRA